ncbi:MAG: lytic transglycosylase domain-containing protein [Opitutaceae bacterium]|nr:lytic transglycosylase domain-containing protein [Opitutaceae bacterium]
MRRFPDFPGWARRALLTASLAGVGAGVMWFARASGDALLRTGPAEPPVGAERPSTGAAAAAEAAPPGQVSAEDLAAAGQRLWEQYVPAEIRAAYEFPSVDELRHFLARLESELDSGSSEEIAAYERDARRALRVLRRCEGGDLLAAWLEPRLDLLKAASQIASAPVARWPEFIPGESPDVADSATVAPAPMLPAAEIARPQYTRTYWDQVLTRRHAPRRAVDLVPRLKEIFAAAGVPPQLVWIAEVESSMNPEATSPVGARGLFQFMPLTAARFGLETGVMVDERTDPEKSARAAAAYLRVLHRRFGSWPLAIAAYNAGEGRVGRLLAREQASSFDAVAHRLPLETRMYVPKVLATVAAREAIDPEKLPGPWTVEAVAEQKNTSGLDAVGSDGRIVGGTDIYLVHESMISAPTTTPASL